MDDILKFCEQMALLNQLKNKKLITMIEYDKIKLYIKKKYKIGVYAMEL
ncbi:conjugal transfer protein [Anaerosolibacter sp.]